MLPSSCRPFVPPARIGSVDPDQRLHKATAKTLAMPSIRTHHMRLPYLLIIAMSLLAATCAAAADDRPQLQEEVWALPLPVPTIAYVVRPVGDGPFPLAIMN